MWTVNCSDQHCRRGCQPSRLQLNCMTNIYKNCGVLSHSFPRTFLQSTSLARAVVWELYRLLYRLLYRVCTWLCWYYYTTVITADWFQPVPVTPAPERQQDIRAQLYPHGQKLLTSLYLENLQTDQWRKEENWSHSISCIVLRVEFLDTVKGSEFLRPIWTPIIFHLMDRGW